MAAAGVDKDGKSKGQKDQPETPSGKTGKAAANKRKRTTKAAHTPTKAADSNDDYEEEDVGNGSPSQPKKARRGAAATPGGGRKEKAVKSEIVIEPIFDANEEQRMLQLQLSDNNGVSIEDEDVGVDAMIKAEEQGGAQMLMGPDEI